MSKTGRLDILVNNAATNPQFGPIIDADEGAINKIWDVNVMGPMRLTRYAVAAWMRDHGGSVINMASVAGIRPEALTGAYNASKAALITLTRTMSHELGPLGIRVNAIAPGLVETKLARYLVETTEIHERILSQTALGRHAVPDEIAGAALFLASDAASYRHRLRPRRGRRVDRVAIRSPIVNGRIASRRSGHSEGFSDG